MFTPNSQTLGQLDGSALKVGIVQARFNPEITNALAQACLAELKAMGVKQERKQPSGRARKNYRHDRTHRNIRF